MARESCHGKAEEPRGDWPDKNGSTFAANGYSIEGSQVLNPLATRGPTQPVGFAIFQGYYDGGDFSFGNQLTLERPAALLCTTTEGGPPRTDEFQPMSDNMSVHANVQLGLDFSPGEGFLHRKRWNPEGIGLVLDLIDPFKFADREKLLGAVLDVSLNWRDFYGATDRHGARFYYPKPEAVGVLEAVGEAADQAPVSYEGKQLTVLEAYRNIVSRLIQALQGGAPALLTPFVYP